MARKPQPLDLSRDNAPDRIEERSDPAAMRWSVILTWFMRVVAVLWIVKGLSAWATILGAAPGASFEGRSTGFQATLIYFAVIDLVAVMSHLILAVFFPRIVVAGPTLIAFFFGLILSYLVMSWLDAREEE